MYPVPTIAQLALYSGRPEASYTSFATSALVQATVTWTALTEITDPSQLAPDDQFLAQIAINAYADYLYLRQPYQQAIAAPFQSETIGSYNYSKAMSEMARNAQAAEVTSEALGIPMFDLGVRMLSLRQRAGGVFYGQIGVFEQGSARYDGYELHWDDRRGIFVVVGPEERDQIDFPMFNINAESFPSDPS